MLYLFCGNRYCGSYYVSGSSSFNDDISAWDTSGVKTMEGMFLYASAFNQPLGDWNIDSVTLMSYMFQAASVFDQDLGWCMNANARLENAFRGTACTEPSCGVTKKDGNGVCSALP